MCSSDLPPLSSSSAKFEDELLKNDGNSILVVLLYVLGSSFLIVFSWSYVDGTTILAASTPATAIPASTFERSTEELFFRPKVSVSLRER